MEISPFMLAKLLLYSFFFGIGTGMFYDCCRIVRVFFGERYAKKKFEALFDLKLPLIKKGLSFNTQNKIQKTVKAIAVTVGDFLSIIFAAVGLIVLNYAYNDGRFRFFTVMGLILGFLLYYFTVGKLVMRISEPIAFLVKYVFCSFFVVLGYPMKKILEFAIKNVRKICFLFIFVLEKRRKKVYNIREKIYFAEMSENGFLKNLFEKR